MGRYDGTKKTAKNLIQKFGVQMTLNRPSTTAATNPWEAPTVTVGNYQCYGVILNFDVREIDGIAIRRDDRKVIIASDSLAVEPNTLDTLTIGAVEFTIQSVISVAPSADAIIYTVQVRTA